MHLMKFKFLIVTVLLGVLSVVVFPAYVVGIPYSETHFAAPTNQNSSPDANLDYLFAVFFLTWLAFFGYIFFLSRKLKSMEKEVVLLKNFIKNNESSKHLDV